jgi:hypothetical protein
MYQRTGHLNLAIAALAEQIGVGYYTSRYSLKYEPLRENLRRRYV